MVYYYGLVKKQLCYRGEKRISTNENIVISMIDELLNVSARVENKS